MRTIWVTLIINKKSGKGLTVPAGTLSEGDDIVQEGFESFEYQLFHVKSVPDNPGEYWIRPLHSNQCLIVEQGGVEDGDQIIQWPCSDKGNRKWKIVPKIITGVGDHQIVESSSTVVPNPFNNELRIRNNKGVIKLRDIQGKLVFKTVNQNTTWNTSALKAGFYIVEEIDGAITNRFKFIKQ